MGFKLPGKSITSGTSGHRSALKMVAKQKAASALKATDWEAMHATAKEKYNRYDDLTTEEYKTEALRQSKKKKETGDWDVSGVYDHRGKKTQKKKKVVLTDEEKQHRINQDKYKADKAAAADAAAKASADKAAAAAAAEEERKSKKTPGLGKGRGKTLTVGEKEAEQAKIAREKSFLGSFPKGGGKSSREKIEIAKSQKEISEIKSGRDDPKTGTMLSRAWHKGRAKRKAKKEAKLKAKNA